MKTENSIRNSFWALLSNIVGILIGLISQNIFLKILNVEYLGINGLFSNIISILGIVELGIGSAIIYNLYKPLSENNITIIKELMNFYKKSYHIIGVVVFFIGILIIPFLNFFVGEVSIDVNIEFVYFLFLLDIVLSYFLSYKRAILQADQKNYIINICHIIYLVAMNTSQLLLLYLTKNYYLYLIVKVIFRLLENVVITIIANNKYSYLKDKNTKKLNSEIKQDIISKVKALFFHKIGTFVVVGTDNIIISKFLGVVSVGLYSNYNLIINSVTKLFSQMLYGVSASIGQLLTENNSVKNYEIFKKLRFINFCIAMLSAICICTIIQPFIVIWLGEEFLLPYSVVIVLSIKVFLELMTNCYLIYKETAGIFKEDQFVPIIQSIINIVISIILVNKLELLGVFLGTIFSSFTYWLYSYPKFIYKNLFKRNYIQYIRENGKYLFIFIFTLAISILLSSTVITNNSYFNFIINVLIGCITTSLSILIIFRKSDELKFVKNIIVSIVMKGVHRNENKN